MANDKIHNKALRRIDLSRRAGCNLETIRYYEGVGVMPEPDRTAAGHRIYDHTHVARLRFVMRARELGFTLAQVRELLKLVDGGLHTCAEVQVLGEEKLADVRARIADLQGIEKVLADTVKKCSGDAVPQCAVLEVLAN
ncbi:MAG: helix-turn-helix domain-containing protein [Paracoccaceae bacterium]